MDVRYPRRTSVLVLKAALAGSKDYEQLNGVNSQVLHDAKAALYRQGSFLYYPHGEWVTFWKHSGGD